MNRNSCKNFAGMQAHPKTDFSHELVDEKSYHTVFFQVIFEFFKFNVFL